MINFDSHFLMTTDTIKSYVVDQLKLFERTSQLEVEEIGDGNINYVFLVRDRLNQKSVVVKQADTLLRSSGRPLDINRNKIEAEILQIQHQLVPEFVPKLFYYDEKMAALTMEDISAYKNLRYELEQESIFPNLADEISTFLVETLLSTTDLVWNRQDKKRQVSHFINVDMCDISEDLVFTEPYNNYKQQNNILLENQDFVEQEIYNNPTLIAEVAKLRNNYLNNAQSLLHGDLHSGSIFINQKGMKVIDPEFAFYGPMGYDMGNVLGNLFFPLAKNYYFGHHLEFSLWLEETIISIYNQLKTKLIAGFKEKVTLDLYRNPLFQETYLNEVMADTLGYAGTEIIRRTIGDSQVKEVSSAPLGEKRVQMERCLLNLGSQLIINRHQITRGAELITYFESAQR